MSTFEALLEGIVQYPLEEIRWGILGDYLEESGEPERAELLRLHRQLIATCCEPDEHPERAGWQSRIVELLAEGVRPCVPRRTLELPGGVEMIFSFIPPGQFLMGSNHWEGYYDAMRIHPVTISKGFFIGIHPVTQMQWKAVMGTNPSDFQGDNRPVEQVSWNDCQEFCTSLNGHLKGSGRVSLPTEAQWEYSCRSGTTTEYHFGNVINPDQVNYNGNYPANGGIVGKYRETTTDVRAFPANPWGLFDVHGNIREWCQDRHEAPRPRGLNLVHRGGGWNNHAIYCRSAYRGSGDHNRRDFYLGVRLALVRSGQ